MSGPIRLYLDSSDYSILSDPQRIGPDEERTLASLLAWVDSGAVECYVSAFHIVEAAPTVERATTAALRRAELMARLCGAHACTFWSDMYSEEARCVRPVIALRNDGRWFPNVDHAIPDPSAFRVSLEQEIANLPTRLLRRKAESLVFKPGTKVLRESYIECNLKGLSLPLASKSDSDRLIEYLVGRGKRQDAVDAMDRVLINPVTCMKWACRDDSSRQQFIELIRKPSVEVVAAVASGVAMAIGFSDRSAAHAEISSDYFLRQWDSHQARILINVANELAGGVVFSDVEDVKRQCPGIYAGYAALLSAWKSSFIKTPRKPRASDFVDGLHALYAPYVDVFRTDGFMAPHVKKTAPEVCVVPKLGALVGAVEGLMLGGRELPA